MAKISKTDIVFQFCSLDDNVPKSDVSFYGWEFGNLHRFQNYIKGYKLAVEATFLRFVESGKEYDIDTQDTIIYPIVFLYRHITELYLKYLYLLLEKPSKEEYKSFLNKNHNIKSLYDCLDKTILNYSKRVGYKVNRKAIDHYIKSIDEVDRISMKYRYPVTKEVEQFHDKCKHLNIVNLHDKMNSFFDYLDSLALNISYQLDKDESNDSFNKTFWTVLESSKDKIKELFEYLKKKEELKSEKNKEKTWLSFSDIEYPSQEDEEAIYTYMKTFTEEQKTVLILLYYVGKTYGTTFDTNNYAIEKEEKIQDILRLLYSYKSECIDFEESSSYKDDIFSNKILGSICTEKYIIKVLDVLETEL